MMNVHLSRYNLLFSLLLLSLWVADAKWEVVRECCLDHETFPDCGRRTLAASVEDLDVDQGDFDFDPDHYEEATTTRENTDIARDDVSDAPKYIDASSLRARKLESKGPFQIKQYWAEGHCWQAEARERRWCLECAGDSCKKGQNLWTMKCDSDDPRQQLVYYKVSSTQGMLCVDQQDLCLQKTSDDFFKLKERNPLNKKQLFEGFKTGGEPFQLRPVTDTAVCVTNYWHHPKPEEVLWVQKCSITNHHNTDMWQTVVGGVDAIAETNARAPNAGRDTVTALGNEYCQPHAQCGECEGDCDTDSDCRGDLKCLQNGDKINGIVPGCKGTDTSNNDFCYDPSASKNNNVKDTDNDNDNMDVTTTTTGKLTPRGGEYCRPDNLCGACEGDCDTDSDCLGNLKCFQDKDKGADGLVPGCTGKDTSKNDYCYDPNATGLKDSKASQTTVLEPVETSAAPGELVPLGGEYCQPDSKCGECEGDCDTDSDCLDGLYCYQRNALQAVPGCTGGESDKSKTDYCVKK